MGDGGLSMRARSLMMACRVVAACGAAVAFLGAVDDAGATAQFYRLVNGSKTSGRLR